MNRNNFKRENFGNYNQKRNGFRGNHNRKFEKRNSYEKKETFFSLDKEFDFLKNPNLNWYQYCKN